MRAPTERKALRASARLLSEKPFACLPQDLLGVYRMMHIIRPSHSTQQVTHGLQIRRPFFFFFWLIFPHRANRAQAVTGSVASKKNSAESKE